MSGGGALASGIGGAAFIFLISGVAAVMSFAIRCVVCIFSDVMIIVNVCNIVMVYFIIVIAVVAIVIVI